ncbi:hypothetical protein HV127_28590 [Klebsiella sp. RHBSTW-00215]|uniref:hypothetical protein n=1 Tax=Klebsiella sp. RHBSTW-00215 TaxID=2742640 RepID=UPI0015F4771E|nr:hypothetical protein [Klebsiella sp. RHBSTW-00215]MBA7935163.1 hypothetical protein [Klebsiella sp. RHBSTW-00215]
MLDFIRDLYASFRQTSLERVKSPVLGAFVFSWIGFNWQMLTILFFSTNKIEDRIEYINKTFDIGSYLLGPIVTTALICFLLPRANKLVATTQDKPNSDTIELTLSSKIKIAEQQQRIAEIEARKKLAEKKEDKFIEESIHQTKNENLHLKSEIKKLEDIIELKTQEIKDIQELRFKDANKIEELGNQINNSKLEVMNASEQTKALTIENIELKTNLKEYNKAVSLNNKIFSEKDEKIQTLERKLIRNDEYQTLLVKNYPAYFEITTSNGDQMIHVTESLTNDYAQKYRLPYANESNPVKHKDHNQ